MDYHSRIIYQHHNNDVSYYDKADSAGGAVDREISYAINIRNNSIAEIRITLNCKDEG